MSNPFISQMISAGDLSFAFTHQLVNGGQSVSLVGFKIEGDPVDSDQEMDNAKVVPLIGGTADVYTNTVRAGTLRFAGTRTTNQIAYGDIVAICQYLQKVGDNVGGTLTASWSQNGAIVSVTFIGVAVKRCKPLHIKTMDAAEYDVQFVYIDYQ
jgi:hypothetical protein